MLSYYRNGLVHIFMHEAIVAVALLSFGNKNKSNKEGGVVLNDLWHEFHFLMNLLS